MALSQDSLTFLKIQIQNCGNFGQDSALTVLCTFITLV